MPKIYYYVNTGHRIGLDRFRRASAVIKELQELDITLLTNDFRIASMAKSYGFKRAVGIDVIRNMPNITTRGDILIYDSQEHSDVILNDMREYFSKLIRFSDDSTSKPVGNELIIYPFNGQESCVPIDASYEDRVSKNEKVVVFFGDDDYEEDLLSLAQQSEFKDCEVLLGFYFFLDAQEKLAPHFQRVVEEDAYEETIKEAGLLITSSYQACLEACLAQTPVVYMQRVDYDQNYTVILEKLGLHIVPYAPITQKMIRTWQREVKSVEVTNSANTVAQIIKKALT